MSHLDVHIMLDQIDVIESQMSHCLRRGHNKVNTKIIVLPGVSTPIDVTCSNFNVRCFIFTFTVNLTY